MKKVVLLFACLLSGFSSRAQDWCEWGFQYDFKIESNNRGEYDLDSLEVNVNDAFSSTRLQKSTLGYNDSTKLYSVNLNYGCISCGYSDAKIPPITYLRLYLTDDFRNQKISIVIPITFDEIDDLDILKKNDSKGNSSYPIYFDLGTIYYENFIFFNSTFEKYEGIRVRPDGEVEIYQNGEYKFPPTKKLIKLKGS